MKFAAKGVFLSLATSSCRRTAARTHDCKTRVRVPVLLAFNATGRAF